MSVNQIACPHCRATLRPSAGLAPGSRIQCPKCAASFNVWQTRFDSCSPPNLRGHSDNEPQHCAR